MANTFSDDVIDFQAYMNMTDHDHKVMAASEYAKQVEDYFHSEDFNHGTPLPWKKAEGKFACRPYEVTIWGGYNGHGKSLVLGQVMNHFMRQKEKVCIASMEMKPHITLARMCRQAAGVNKPDIEYIHRYHKGTDGLFWLYDQQGTVNGQKMLAVIKYAQEKYGINHFVVDSLLKCGFAEDDYTGQKLFVDSLCSIARDTGVHIHLVHHARKSQGANDEYDEPGKHSMKGSSSIVDQVDNLLIIWRNKRKEDDMQAGKQVNLEEYDMVIAVRKQRNGEWEGKLGFYFDHQGRGINESPYIL